MKLLIRNAMLSIAFFTIALTPYSFFWLHMTWEQYGRWSVSNIAVSALAGPALLALIRWIDAPETS